MERRLSALVDGMKICLNFLAMACLELAVFNVTNDLTDGYLRQSYGTVAQTVTTAPVFWVQLFLPAVIPFLFYLIRKYSRHLILFLVLHPVVVGTVMFLTNFLPCSIFWKFLYLVVGIAYGVLSARIRLVTRDELETHREDTEENWPLGAAGVMAFLSFLICSYFGDDAGASGIIWLAFAWMLLNFVVQYLENYLHYVEMSRKTSGSLPEQHIFRAGMTGVGLFTAGSVVLLVVCSKTTLVSKMTQIAKWIGWNLLRAIVWLLTLFEGGEEEELLLEQQMESGGNMMEAFGEAAETPWWIEVLEKFAIAVTVILMVALFVLMVYLFVRWLIRQFYGRERKPAEIHAEDFIEEEEPLRREKKRRTAKLPVIGGTAAERIRKIFKKTVIAAKIRPEGQNGLFRKKKEDNSYKSALLYGSEAYQEETRFDPAGKTARELSGEQQEWKRLVSLYEKVRYSDSAADMEEAREAGKLSKEILHNIK